MASDPASVHRSTTIAASVASRRRRAWPASIAMLAALAASSSRCTPAPGTDSRRAASVDARIDRGSSSPRSAPSIAPGLREVRMVDERATALAERARAATVCLLFQNQGGTRSGSGSGVLVSNENGKARILTCGHLAREAGRRCRAVLPDGRLLDGEVMASVMQDGIDLALVECDAGDAELPTLAIAAQAPRVGDWVMVLGHPRGLWTSDASAEEVVDAELDASVGSAPPRWDTRRNAPLFEEDAASIASRLRPPIVRTGRIWDEPGAGTGVRFDAPIDAGDSGGPVIDLDGRVIAIASRCGWKSHWNWACSLMALEGDAGRLLDPSIAWPANASEPGAGSGSPQAPERSRDHEDFLADLRSTATLAIGRSVATVESEGGPRCFAIAVAPGGAFATKGSEAGFTEPIELVAGGRRSTARRIAYDADADLLLLQADGLDLLPMPLPTAVAPLQPASLLLSVGPDGDVLAIGGVSLEPFRAEEVDARPFLGVSSRARDDGAAVLRSITPGTPAARAGLRAGDAVRSVEGVELSQGSVLADRIALLRAGDRMRLEFERDGERRSTEAILARRAPSMRSRDRGNTRVAVSAVLPYRTIVFAHDGSIEPHECGSPVIDLAGRPVGVNLARFDRTSTWAMPIDEFARSVRALLLEPPADPARFDAFADTGFVATEASGRVRLAAEDARTIGERDLRRAIGELRAIDGSGVGLHQDDRLAWDLQLERPGRFEV
ncbi:MAG: PDZ domain-containing protein, partial [Phycisphaerae bacterium]|nr:PDZ domain-containing protein [Phycisphaerae bacterium]